MNVLNVTALKKFARKHRDAADWLDNWRAAVDAAEWRSIADVRKVYASADGVPVKATGGETVIVTIFNVKGNEYRLLARLDYGRQNVLVIDVLTHSEYSRNKWKDRL